MGRLPARQRREGKAGKLTLLARLLARQQLAFTDTPDTQTDDDASALAQALADAGLRLKRKPHAGAAPPARGHPPVFELWREHEAALFVWGDVQTSWRTGMAGATGLHKGDVEKTIRAHGYRGERARQVFLDLLVMERATLDEWAKQRERERRTWRD